jgi:hypothetical protein
MIGLRLSNVMVPADHARFPSFDDYLGSRKWNLWGYIDGSAVPVINAVVGGSLGRDAGVALVDCRGVDARHYAVGVATEAAQVLWRQDVDDE